MGVTITLGTRRAGATRAISVALVGRELAGDENLSLRYLAGALVQGGHRPVIVPLGGPGSLEGAAAKLEAARPEIVGLSLPDADIAIDALAFVRYLRERGYGGHITCGGPLATLVRHELLDKHAGIDSVIRHDGELPLVELADRIATGRSWGDIAGISTRNGDGPPARVADPTPLHTRPIHADPLPRLLGVGTARISASRGCPGRCPYCGPAALQREAIQDARDSGLSRKERLEAGVGKTRYRHYTDLAEEVADLYHGSGARFFQVVDENLLSGGEERASKWLAGLMKELRRLGVKETAWCLQADPATLTERTIDQLEELGAIRISVGIEGLTTTQLRALGRWGETTDHIALLETLRDRGIVTSFNSLIVHPQSTVADIHRELEALAALPPIHFDVLSMAVYPGTQAYQSLLREGRVTGGMLALRFEPREIAVNRFRAALIKFRLEAIGRYGVNTFAHDVAINLALARRLGLPHYEPALGPALESVVADLNRARVDALQTALALAAETLSDAERFSAMHSLGAALKRDLAPCWERIQRVQHRLQGTSGGPIAPTNLMFASAMATSFVLCLTSVSGCGGQTVDDSSVTEPPRDASVLLDATTGTGGAMTGTGGLNGSGGTLATGGSMNGTGGTEPSCSEDALWSLVDAHSCPKCQDGDGAYGIAIDPNGRVTAVLTPTGAPVSEPIARCYMEALSNQTFPCLSGEEHWYECVVTLL